MRRFGGLSPVGLGMLAAMTLAGQQGQFSGSVPQGTATPTPVGLTLRDALDRGLKTNLGLLSERFGQRGCPRPAAGGPQCPASVYQRPDQPDRRTKQPENTRLEFQVSGSFDSHHHRPLSLHRRPRVCLVECLRLFGAQESPGGARERTRGAPVSAGCARPGGAACCVGLSADYRRLIAHHGDPLAGGDGAGAL